MSNGNQPNLLKWWPVAVVCLGLLGNAIDLRIRFDRIEQAASKDLEQDEKIRKHWKLLRHLTDETTILRHEHDLPPTPWPNLD